MANAIAIANISPVAHFSFTSPSFIMEQTPATRFVDVLGRLGYKTQQQIADLLDIARPTAGTIVRYEKPPSFESVATLKEKHPEINMEWVFTGNGTAFATGETAPAQVVAHTRTHGEARATAHPTIQPTDRELASGAAVGPTMQGIIPGEATPGQVSFVDRLIRNLEEENAKKDALIEWLQQQNAVLLGKSPGNLLAAGLPYPSPVSMALIGPRFDNLAVEAKVLKMYPEPLKQAA